MAKARGFSIIEVMIAVAIVGILAAIAIPSYNGQLRKARRADAAAFLTQVSQKQQQYLMDARTYALGATALTTLNLTPPATVSDWYAVTVTPAAATSPPSFTVTATPIAGKAQEKDGPLSLTHTGVKQRVDPVQGTVSW